MKFSKIFCCFFRCRSSCCPTNVEELSREIALPVLKRVEATSARMSVDARPDPIPKIVVQAPSTNDLGTYDFPDDDDDGTKLHALVRAFCNKKSDFLGDDLIIMSLITNLLKQNTRIKVNKLDNNNMTALDILIESREFEIAFWMEINYSCKYYYCKEHKTLNWNDYLWYSNDKLILRQKMCEMK